jgi:hypothetical protein
MVIKRIIRRKPTRIKLSDYFAMQKNEMRTFKLTPHVSVTNNQNAKMWRVLHKIYEIYDSMPTRLSREGTRFTYREKDTIWFDVIFRQVDGVKSIEFYVSTTELWAKKFREIIENYMKVTVEEVELDALQIPDGDTTMQEVRLARHDIFSLRANKSEQTSPISSVMTALDDIAMDGDFARLSVCSETFDRRKWARNASWAHEKLSKGKTPQRAKLTPRKATKALKHGATTLINEIYDVINDTLSAVTNVFFKGDSRAFKSDEKAGKRDALLEELNTTRTSERSTNKINQPVFKTRIRVAAQSTDKLRSELVANTITSAFSEIAEDNELVPFKIRYKARKEEVKRELNTLQLSQRTKSDGDCSLLSCDELAKVSMQMPTAAVQQRYEEELATNKKVETEIPAVFRKEGGCIIGHSELKGESLPVYLPTNNYDELFRSYVFQGSQGMGKDTAIKNFIVEMALNHGIGAIIPDAINESGNRGMADGIRDSLPADKVIDIDLSDSEYPVPMDLTEIIRKLGKNGANRFAQELIDFFGDMESMGQSRSVLREFAKASGGSIYAIKRLLENEDYRNQRAKELRNEGNIRLAESLEKWATEWGEDKNGNAKVARDGQKALDSKASAILNRLDELMGDDVLFNIFAQPPTPELDFERWITEGKVVILRIPNRKLGTLATKTLMHWITLKTFMTKMLMDDPNVGAFIVYNEPHQYMTTGLERLLQRIVLEGRKWRLGSLYAFHHIGLLPRTFADDLQASGTNWFLFSNTHKAVYERLDEELAPNFDVTTAMMTEKYHAICLLSFGGRRRPAFLMKALKPTTDRLPTNDNSFLTRRHSRQFGRHWQEVEAMLA